MRAWLLLSWLLPLSLPLPAAAAAAGEAPAEVAPPVVAEEAAPPRVTLAGIALPEEFARNETLSVAGQQVYEHIDEMARDLVAITPAVRPRSVMRLQRMGFLSFCEPRRNGVEHVLYHRRGDGMTWFIVAEGKTAHIVLAEGSMHFEHFLDAVRGLCRGEAVKEET